ncbi:hypothetical protein P4679_30760 [Priestia megaterium]|uniref:hypothetical protein n=1 Tax=Priestia megaterium TaxID=1404 RepID=UPI002E250D96|nr:hypothetical protein [Priestia megaterium]
MDFKDLTLDNIDSATDDELLEMMYQSFMEVKPVKFIKQEMHDLSKHIAKPRFDYIKKEIAYGNEDNYFFIKVPIVDEEERSHFKVNVFSKEGFHDRMPKDGFMKMTSRIDIKPFGVIDVYFEGSVASRKPHEFKHLNYNRSYEHIESFYYDFDSKQYIGVDDEQMAEARRGLFRDPNFDFKDSPERVQEYFRRERLTEAIKNRLKEQKELCEDVFLAVKDTRYNVLIADGITTTQENITAAYSYVLNYKDFLNDTVPKWLKLKLVFAEITLTEYNKLIQEINNLLQVIALGINILERMAVLIQSKTGGNPMLFNWNGLDGGSEEEILKQEFVKQNGPKDQLERFLTPRPAKFDKYDPLLGFIGYDLETKEVYANIAETERRLYRTEEHSSFVAEEEYHSRIIEHFSSHRQD